MPLGSMTEAETIFAAFKAPENKDVWYSEMTLPDGWAYLGHGMYRCAFLSPSGVVYKLETGKYAGSQSNRGEYERILEMRFSDSVKTAGVIIPKAWLYSVKKRDVIAMEFMDGEWASAYHSMNDCDCGDRFGGTCAMTQFMNLERMLGMTDIHEGNAVFIPAQKSWALIDLGA